MNEVKKVSLKSINKIIKLLEEKNGFNGFEILNITYLLNDFRITVCLENEKYILKFKDILKLEYDISFDNLNCIRSILIYKHKNEIYFDCQLMSYHVNRIMLEAKNVEIEYDDIANSIYRFVSVKYSEDSLDTYYYLSDDETIKEGDYVWVDAKDKKKVAVVYKVELIKYEDAPYPIYKLKYILKKATYKEYCINHGIMDYEPVYNIENEETLISRCNKIEVIKTQELKYVYPKKNSKKPGYYKYTKELNDFIKSVDELNLYDENFEFNFKFIKNKEIEEMSVRELITMLSYILNVVVEGGDIIADSLSDGTLEKISKALKVCK